MSVLPPGVDLHHGPAPPPPDDFEDGFVLPAHCEKPLQRVHTHPLDARLSFFEKPHVYTFDDVPTSMSVTGLAHAFERGFVAAEAIALMKKSKKEVWPRVKYVFDATPIESDDDWHPGRGALMVTDDGLTVGVVQPHSLDEESTLAHLRRMMLTTTLAGDFDSDECTLMSFSREMTDAEIADMWNRNGKRAANEGTEAHYLAELYFNGLPTRWWEPEMQTVMEFAHTHLIPNGMVAHNTEKEIVCQDADVAGSIDLIVFDPSRNQHHIIDHKRTAKLPLREYSRMLEPFDHLDACKGAAYALQTSIYQYILERDYGMSIGDRILLCMHPDNPRSISVPYLKAEVEYIMQHRFALVRARKAVAQEFEEFRCAVTSAPLVDAVRLDDGRIVMEKVAQIRDWAYTPDLALRDAFDNAVKAWCDHPAPQLDRDRCISWKRLMPTKGKVPFADLGPP